MSDSYATSVKKESPIDTPITETTDAPANAATAESGGFLAKFKSLDWNFIRGSSFNSLGIAIARVLGFAFSFVVARALNSTEDYGYVVYVITLAGVVAVLTQPFGQHVMAYLIGKNHKDEDQRNAAMDNAWTVMIGLMFVTLLVGVPVLMALQRFSIELMVVFIGITCFYTYYGISSGFLASGRLLAAYLGSNLVQILLIVLVVMILEQNETPVPALIIYGLAYFLPMALLIAFAPLPVRFRLGRDWQRIRQIVSFSVPIWLSHILYIAYFSTDILMLEAFSDNSAVGVYGLTKTLSSAFHFIPGGITLVLMPKIAGLPKEDHGKYLMTSIGVSLLVNFIGGVIYMALYQWFIINFFGAEYFIGLDFGFLMAFGAILTGIHGVISAVMIGSGRTTQNTISRAAMLMAMLSLGFLLIPTQGAMGAAFTILGAATAGLLTFVVLYIAERRLQFFTPKAQPDAML